MFSFIKSRFFLVTNFSPFLGWTFIGFTIAAFFCYFYIDFPLIEKIASYSLPLHPLPQVLSLVIFPPFHLVLWLLAFIWARFFSKRREWTLPLFEIFIVQAFSIAVVRIFKVVIGRVRPESFLSKALTGFEFLSPSHHYHSLPSGHSMTAFTLAASIALLFPRLRYLSLLLALLFSLNRVYLLDHFPSDLFATGAIGILIAQKVHTMLQKVTTQDYRKKQDESIYSPRNRCNT